MSTTESEVWQSLARAISGHTVDFADLDAEQVLDVAGRNGVAPLLHHRLCEARTANAGTPGSPPRSAPLPEALTGASSPPATPFRPAPINVDPLQTATAPAALAGTTPLLIEGLRQLTHREVARDLAINAAAAKLVNLLAENGIPVLLLKGTALAHLHYPLSWLRTRTDIDVYLPAEAITETERLLLSRGYQVTGLQADKSHVRQFHASNSRFGGEALWFDLHYGISNRNLFRDCLPFASCFESRQPVPALGPHAYAPGDAELLLHACVHRIAHGRNADRDRLIWLYDIHLLWAALTRGEDTDPEPGGFIADALKSLSPYPIVCMYPVERDMAVDAQPDSSNAGGIKAPRSGTAKFTRLALEAGLGALCADALARCREVFGNGVSDAQLTALRAQADREPSAKLLRAGKIGWVLADLQAEPGFQGKLRLLRELLQNQLA